MSGYIWSGGGQPFGYTYDQTNKKLIVDIKENQVLQKIFSLALSGLGTTQIAKELNKYKLPTRSGSNWVNVSVFQILSPERIDFYLGYMNGERGDWNPLIKTSDADKLKQQKLPSAPKKKRKNRHYLLSANGILHCGYCGSTVKAHLVIKKNGKSNEYYQCTKKQMGGLCSDFKLMRQADVNDLVLTELKVLLSSNPAGRVETFISEAQRKLKEKTLPELTAQIGKKNLDLEALQDTMALELERIKAIQDIEFPFSKKEVDRVLEILNSMDEVKKSETIQLFVKDIILFTDRIIIKYLYPLKEGFESYLRIDK